MTLSTSGEGERTDEWYEQLLLVKDQEMGSGTEADWAEATQHFVAQLAAARTEFDEAKAVLQARYDVVALAAERLNAAYDAWYQRAHARLGTEPHRMSGYFGTSAWVPERGLEVYLRSPLDSRRAPAPTPDAANGTGEAASAQAG